MCMYELKTVKCPEQKVTELKKEVNDYSWKFPQHSLSN